MGDKSFLLEDSDFDDELSENSNNIGVNTDENEEQEIEREDIDIDEFLRHGGECGRYQIMVQLGLMIAMLPMVYPIMIFYYIGYDPSWTCVNNNMTHSQHFGKICNDSTKIFSHDNKDRCGLHRSEWTYNYTKKTLVTDFDLVCDQNWLDALTGSIVFIGWGLGIIVMGFLSDRYGRKRVMYPCLFLTLIFLFLHAVVNQIWQLIVIRFFMGIFFCAPALNSYIMVVELIGPNKRVMATTLNSFLWPIGALVMTLKAKYIDNWRTLIIICSLPYLIGVSTVFFVPESVRWLNLKGRTREAEAILRKAAKYNKRVLPAVALKSSESDKNHSKKASYIDMFKRWKIAKSMLAQAFIWFQCGMTYYGLNWTFADLGGDMYSNFVLSFLVELPGVFVVWYLMQKIGRRKTCIMMCVGTALACFGVTCVPKVDKLKVLRVFFGLTGKFMISNVFVIIYMWSSEIYPTSLRTQGMGINIVTSRAGAATSPFIKILDQFHAAAPFALMMVCAVIATVLSLTLPETLDKPTRETLDDMIRDGIEMRAIYSLDENVEFHEEQSPVANDDVSLQDESVEETDLLLLPKIQVLPAVQST